jgi:adenine-specific DNA glycosylase
MNSAQQMMKTKIDIRRILQVPTKPAKKFKSFDQGLMGLGINITTKESLK